MRVAHPSLDGEFGDYSSLNLCYFDLDLSGEVGANDLLNLLNTYGQEAGCSGAQNNGDCHPWGLSLSLWAEVFLRARLCRSYWSSNQDQ